MFWGSFAGNVKGLGVFWEKDWGTINKESYSSHIVPLIHGWIRMKSQLSLMQDGAPGHLAASTRQELQDRSIRTIFWPAYSPDLNPIKTVWNEIKDWIQDHYPEKMNYDQLRGAVIAAWQQISVDFLNDLVDSMPKRCEAVIMADRMHTKY